jgi:transposase
MRQTLNQLAQMEPQWLKSIALADWYERYGRRFDSFHLPESREKRQELANQIGHDGYHLLMKIYEPEAPSSLRSAFSVNVLRQVWLQQYKVETTGPEVQILMRTSNELPPAAKRIFSPYDPEARYARHDEKEWVGYRTHITESCDEGAPIHLITHVETVVGTTQDVEVCETIHTGLAEQGLTPAEHFVDAAYLSANLLAKITTENKITLVGPVTKLQDVSWQAREQSGYDSSQFKIDWNARQVTCPNGQTSVKWVDNCRDRTGNEIIHVAFSATVCRPCPARTLCTRRQRDGRNMQLRPQAQYEALKQARAQEVTEAFKKKYRTRLGVEGTISQAVRAFELRETRYRGLLKTHLQAIALAAAIDLCRFWDYICDTGLGQTRVSPFAGLAGGT